MFTSMTAKVLVGIVFLSSIAAASVDSEDKAVSELCYVCFCTDYEAVVDCSRRGLSELPFAESSKVTHLNASNNELSAIPIHLSKLSNLKVLDLSNNQIDMIASNALQGLDQLEVLNLAKNSFNAWFKISPNDVLVPAGKLRILDLSHNKFGAMGNLEKNELLVSSTLEQLFLEDCDINTIHGKSPISGLSNIKWLKLSHNPLRRIQNIISPTLRSLDVSYCQLGYVHHETLSYLPSLVNLQMAHNYRLVLATPGTTLLSESLRYLDISSCNVMETSIGGFPNLRKAVLSRNLVRFFTDNQFQNSTKLEYLDLSYNSIGSLKSRSFRRLSSLKYLDLSWNEISDIPEETFGDTPVLTHINLSRNYLTKVGHLKSLSITSLDMSQCEISIIDKDSLEGLQSLNDLNLSRNLISLIPDTISSNTLQYLYLNYNRIGSVNNNTFSMLPRLTTLSLVGNRFTGTWKASYFYANPYLEQINLGDNMWRCDCGDSNMRDFYEFLTIEPSKEESYNLVCNSPNILIGETWFEACYLVWYPSAAVVTPNGLIWFLMSMIIGLTLCFLIVSTVRRITKRRMAAIQVERERQVEEARDRLRQLRMRAEQEALINTPDPRDLVAPPSYDEALSMPKLNTSCHSLNDVGSGKSKRRRGRRKTKSSGDLLEDSDRDNGGRVFEDLELSEIPEQNNQRRRRRRKSLRCGSHEINQLEQSPGSRRRRRVSLYDAENVESVTINIEADVERPIRSSNRHNSIDDDNATDSV